MNDLVYAFAFPHFTQSLIAAAFVATLPLRKKQEGQYRFYLGLFLAFWVGGGLEYLYLYNLLSSVLPLYYVFPLGFAFGYICLALKGSLPDEIHALSLAYLCQHIGFCLSNFIRISYEAALMEVLAVALLRWSIHLLILFLAYRLVICKLVKEGHFCVTLRSSLVTLAMVLFIALGLNYVFRKQMEESFFPYLLGIAYDVFCCIFLLWIQLEQRRSAEYWSRFEMEKRLRLLGKEQYEQSRIGVAALNQKCHDLKHALTAFRLEKDPVRREQGLLEMEEAVLLYDSVAKTGNEVLDTVLTQKSLVCEKEKVGWTCLADGALLDFMSTVDLYTLFGNALDNAIESCRQLKDPERRIISVVVRREYGMALIQIQNYYGHSLKRNGGELATTKENEGEHGFGLKSIRSIAERYGGMVDVKTEGGVFLLTVMIPLPM